MTTALNQYNIGLLTNYEKQEWAVSTDGLMGGAEAWMEQNRKQIRDKH